MKLDRQTAVGMCYSAVPVLIARTPGKRHKITYGEIAKGTSLHYTTVSRWSKNQLSQFPKDGLEKFCRFFRCGIESLIVFVPVGNLMDIEIPPMRERPPEAAVKIKLDEAIAKFAMKRRANISYRKIAREAGVPLVKLSKLGRGETTLFDKATISRLCLYLECQPCDIIAYE